MADGQAFMEAAYFAYKEVICSEGFFVTSNYGRYVPGGIRRIGSEETDEFQQAEKAARFALQKEDPSLEFVKIVNLTMQPTAGAIYYITMEAKNSSTDNADLYQTKVWETLNTGFRVHLFRPAKAPTR